MKLEVNLEKRGVFLIVGAVLILAGVIGAIAYTNSIPNPGHGGDSVLVNTSNGEMTLQEAIDQGLIGGSGSSGSGGGLEYTGSTEIFHSPGDIAKCPDATSTIMLMEYFGGKPENGNEGCFVDNQGTTSVQGRVVGAGPACRWACFK